MNNAPIGIFDSGLGGLTVARAVIDKLPDEEIIYLGDTEHTPYGPRAIAQVRSLTLGNATGLMQESPLSRSLPLPRARASSPHVTTTWVSSVRRPPSSPRHTCVRSQPCRG